MMAISRKVRVGKHKATMHLASDGALHVEWPNGAPHSISSAELYDSTAPPP